MLFMDNSKIKSFLVYLVAVGAGIGLAKLGFDLMTVKLSPGRPAAETKPRVEAVKNVVPVIPAARSIPQPPVPGQIEPSAVTAPKENKPDASSYLLTGVYFSGNKAFALINNQIVEEGDEIAEAKVFKINLDEVTLKLSDDQIIKLTTRSRYP